MERKRVKREGERGRDRDERAIERRERGERWGRGERDESGGKEGFVSN